MDETHVAQAYAAKTPQCRDTTHDLHTDAIGTAISRSRLWRMSEIRRSARNAKAMLGRTGTIRRVAAFATVYQGFLTPDDWVVETLDSAGDGGIYITVFCGPKAKERAVEYAEEKYSGVQLRDAGPLPHK